MTEYTITINGYESGLTRYTVEEYFKNKFPEAENIEVSEQ